MRRRLVVGLLGAALLLGYLSLQWQRQRRAAAARVVGSGVVEGTQVDMAARIAARLERQVVWPGAEVAAGDVLVQLDCAEQQTYLAEAQARLQAAVAQVRSAAATAQAASYSHGAVAAAAQAAAAQTEALTAQRDAAAREAQRLRALGEDASVAKRDQSASVADDLRHRVEAQAQQTAAQQRQALAAQAGREAAQAQLEAAQAAQAAGQAALTRAELLVQECQLRAPQAGIVEDIYYEVGEWVPLGAAVLRLVDLREAKIVFYVGNNDLGAVRPGALARVQADAYPHESFTGTVTTVGAVAEFTPRNIQTRDDRERLVYPVEVRVANPQRQLRSGMPVEVVVTAPEQP